MYKDILTAPPRFIPTWFVHDILARLVLAFDGLDLVVGLVLQRVLDRAIPKVLRLHDQRPFPSWHCTILPTCLERHKTNRKNWNQRHWGNLFCFSVKNDGRYYYCCCHVSDFWFSSIFDVTRLPLLAVVVADATAIPLLLPPDYRRVRRSIPKRAFPHTLPYSPPQPDRSHNRLVYERRPGVPNPRRRRCHLVRGLDCTVIGPCRDCRRILQ
mmetsp:Transcript_9415/g.19561  ORF Transcript_9415/g.19561 Transcript_9415/m.19561 type:complete len:212 (-) Transcript_9415:511-1146(-)